MGPMPASPASSNGFARQVSEVVTEIFQYPERISEFDLEGLRIDVTKEPGAKTGMEIKHALDVFGYSVRKGWICPRGG